MRKARSEMCRTDFGKPVRGLLMNNAAFVCRPVLHPSFSSIVVGQCLTLKVRLFPIISSGRTLLAFPIGTSRMFRVSPFCTTIPIFCNREQLRQKIFCHTLLFAMEEIASSDQNGYLVDDLKMLLLHACSEASARALPYATCPTGGLHGAASCSQQCDPCEDRGSSWTIETFLPIPLP